MGTRKKAETVSAGTKCGGSSPAATARRASGLTCEEAAARARISPAYLRRVERRGATYPLARRLAHLYQCPIDVFLPTPGGETPEARRGGGTAAPAPLGRRAQRR